MPKLRQVRFGGKPTAAGHPLAVRTRYKAIAPESNIFPPGRTSSTGGETGPVKNAGRRHVRVWSDRPTQRAEAACA